MPFIHMKEFTGGMNYANSDFLKNPNELKILNGCNVDYKLGAIVEDLGYSQIGDVPEANKSITGLYNFRQAAGTQKMLLTVNDATDDDTQLFYSTGGNWTEVTAAETAWANEANGAIEMEAMDAYCYIVGWNATDGFLPPASFTGTTFSTSANVTSMPGAKYIKRYRDRIYIANCDITGTAYPYRVYFSTVPTGGAITWTVATNFLDVDYGEYITGLGENWDRLLVFTSYSCYMYNQSEWKKAFDVGCSAHRTLKNSGVYTLWANGDGVWMSTGGQPMNISGKMLPFFKASTPANWFAEVVDEEYHIYIGNVTVDGVAYSKVKLKFNIPHQTWSVRELYDTPTIFAKYNSSGNVYLWHGDTDGEVMQYSKYNDATPIYADDGNKIKSCWITPKLDFGEPQNSKMIKKMMTYTTNAQGLVIYARLIDKNDNALMDWKRLGECKKYINEFTNLAKGNFIEIKGLSNDTVKYWIFDGMSFDVELETKKQ